MGDYLSRLTFYDIVGYLLPGAVGLLALAVACALVDPAWALAEPTGAGAWTLAIVGTYFLGHAIQGIAFRILSRGRMRDAVARAASGAVDAVVVRALESNGSTPGQSVVDRFAALDALKIDFSDREVFTARQGFYRGSSVAFGLLTLVLAVAAIWGRSVAVFGYGVPRAMAAVGALLGLGCCVIFVLRYRDFIRHEMEYAAASGLKPKSA